MAGKWKLVQECDAVARAGGGATSEMLTNREMSPHLELEGVNGQSILKEKKMGNL